MKKILIILLLFNCTYFAISQEKDSAAISKLLDMSIEELLEIKVKVSTSVPNGVMETPSTVTVITEDMIREYNFQSLADVLNTVAGIQVLQTNNERNVVTFRGILQNYYMNKILIMIDNVPTWQTIYGSGSIDQISLSDIERIEILKGPASIMYGTNAYTGVINLITHNNETSGINSDFEFEAPKSGRANLNTIIKRNDFSLYLSGSAEHFDRERYPFKLTADSTMINGGYLFGNDTLMMFNEKMDKFSLVAKAKYKAHSLFVNSYSYNYNFYGINLSVNSAAGHSFMNNGVLTGYNYEKKIGEQITITGLLNYEYFHRYFDANAFGTNALELASDRILTRIQGVVDFNKYFSLEAHTDFQTTSMFYHNVVDVLPATVIRSNLSDKASFNEFSFVVQPKLNFDFLYVIGGIMYTKNVVSGERWTKRITFNFKLNESNRLKLIYGEAYRSPNMLELYFDHPTVVGSESLTAEESYSTELVFLRSSEHYLLQIAGYYANYSNLIQRYRPSTDINIPATYRNADEFNGYGTEFEFRYQNKNLFNAFFNYNFIGGIDDFGNKTNYDLVPDHTFSLGISKNYKKWMFSTNLFGYSRVKGLLEEIPPQMQLNASISYRHLFDHGIKVTHSLLANNITGSNMTIPEYIRQRPDLNSLPTRGYGLTISYIIRLSF